MIRVPLHLGFDDIDGYLGAGPTEQEGPPSAQPIPQPAPSPYEALKSKFDAVVANADHATPAQVLSNLLEIQKQALTLERAAGGPGPLEHGVRSIRFAVSKAAVHIFKSLTKEGREQVRPTVRQILDHTPHLRGALHKDHFRYDEQLHKFILPNGKVHPGKALGLEKQRLGVKEEELSRRGQMIRLLKETARNEGRKFTQEEIRDILDTTKPAPAHGESELKRYHGRRPEEQSKAGKKPSPVGYAIPRAWVGKRHPPVRRGLQGYYGLGQEQGPEADAYLQKADGEFRAADVEKKAEILDQVTDMRSALDAGVKPAAAAQDAAKATATATGGISPTLLIGIGGVAVAGIALYFFMKKR